LHLLPEDWEKRVGRFLPASHIYPLTPFLGNHKPPSITFDGFTFQEIRGVIDNRRPSIFNRQYTIEIATLRNRFKGEIVDLWVRHIKDEGEKSLIGTIEAGYKTAKNLMTSPLERDDKSVQQFIAMYGNLVAAEEALKELSVRVETLRTQSVK
jgi:hypothetical protein